MDSDKVLDDFFNFCFIAGKGVCAFWHSSYAEIRQAFITVDEKLHQSPSPAGPTRQLDWSQFRVYIWNALKNPVTSWTGAGGLDKFLSLLEQNQLGKLTAPAADALFEYIARGNHEITSNDTLVDPTTGLRNGGENSEVIAAVDNPYSFGNIQSLLPFFQSPAVTSTGYLLPSILGTYGILSNCTSRSSPHLVTLLLANIYPLPRSQSYRLRASDQAVCKYSYIVPVTLHQQSPRSVHPAARVSFPNLTLPSRFLTMSVHSIPPPSSPTPSSSASTSAAIHLAPRRAIVSTRLYSHTSTTARFLLRIRSVNRICSPSI